MSEELETCIVCGGKEPCSHDFDEEKKNLRKVFTPPKAMKTVTLKDGTVLWEADPNCKHELDPNCWSGIKCLHCTGWYCD